MEKIRTQKIAAYIRQRRVCTYGELMKKFGVSSATIHRYAAELESRGVVRRLRGGLAFNEATAAVREDATAYLDRVVTNRAEKIAAAQKAFAIIEEGDIVFLDSSTTVYELALLLKSSDFAHLTIVTNAVAIIQNFRKFPPNFVLIALGGTYDAQLNCILGTAALEQLSHFNITKAFVSGFGVDNKTVTTNHERLAELLNRVLAQADRRYLVVDRSKFTRKGLYRLSARGSFDAVFTD